MKRLFKQGQSYLVLGLVLLISACASSPKTAYYTLGLTEPTPTAPIQLVNSVKSIGIARVQLPTLLNRTGLVLRSNAFNVEVSENHQWAGDLRNELTSLLIQQLQTRLPKTHLQTAPWELEQTPQYEIALQLTQFDGMPDGKAYLKGRWQLSKGTTNQLLASELVNLETKVAGKTVEAVVQAQSRLISDLADQLVAHLPATP